MREPSPTVVLGEVIRQRKEFVRIDDVSTYKRCRVQLHSQGIVLRDQVAGAEIKTKAQQVCRTGEFLVAEIDAKVGGYGIVPPDLDGAIVSSHYFLFEIDTARLDRGLLGYFVRTPAFAEQVAAQGSTNYAAIRPDHVLGYKIPLPPLAVQRRIVAKIDALATKIKEAHGLRQTAIEGADALPLAEINRCFPASQADLPSGWGWVCVGDLGPEGVEAIQTGPFGAQLHKSDFVPEGRPVLAIGNVQWGYLDTSTIDYVKQTKAAELSRYTLAEGDVLFTRSGTVGRSAVVPQSADGWLMTGHILRIRLDRSRCNPRYLFYGFRGSRAMQAQVEGSSRGATRSGFNTTLLGKVEFPLPPVEEQRRIVAYLDGLQVKVDALKALQAQTAAELDAMLPAVLDRAFKGGL